MAEEWTTMEFRNAEAMIMAYSIHVFDMAKEFKDKLPFMERVGLADISLQITLDDNVCATFFVGDECEPPTQILLFPFELMNEPLEKLTTMVEVVCNGHLFKLVKKDSK